MVNFDNKAHYDVYDLKKIVSRLRGPGGCPWDAEQTHESIRRNFLLDDVADRSVRKLIFRHPHVFGSRKVSGSDEVLENWDVIKRAEKKQETHADALAAVARSLPGLWRAEKLQKKAAKAGFDWPDVSGAMDKLYEEFDELRQAAQNGGDTEEELGDLLFSAVNVARFLGIDPERALGRSCDKFIERFTLLEEAALSKARPIEEMTLEELDELYEAAKTRLKNKIEG
jgi:tetrapyrrole methylase family protein/MazG family protein